jgi:hypothetical protein
MAAKVRVMDFWLLVSCFWFLGSEPISARYPMTLTQCVVGQHSDVRNQKQVTRSK